MLAYEREMKRRDRVGGREIESESDNRLPQVDFYVLSCGDNHARTQLGYWYVVHVTATVGADATGGKSCVYRVPDVL